MLRLIIHQLGVLLENVIPLVIPFANSQEQAALSGFKTVELFIKGRYPAKLKDNALLLNFNGLDTVLISCLDFI